MKSQVDKRYFNISDKKEFHSGIIIQVKKGQTFCIAYFMKEVVKTKYRGSANGNGSLA